MFFSSSALDSLLSEQETGNRKSRGKRGKYHIKKVFVEIRDVSPWQQLGDKKLTLGWFMPRDVATIGMRVFSEIPFNSGQEIVITLLDDKSISFQGKVHSHQNIDHLASSGVKVLHKNEFKFRLEVKFKSNSEFETKQIEEYVAKIKEKYS